MLVVQVVQAAQAAAPTIVAQPAMDAWSLGVVAVELFCKRTVLDVLEGRDKVRSSSHRPLQEHSHGHTK